LLFPPHEKLDIFEHPQQGQADYELADELQSLADELCELLDD
tara:strand:- start:2187 stop:2312 length:126 start_codon:yes stop_codon:yes gene_type:complete